MFKKSVAIIQARMGSTRLPGKVAKKIQGDSILSHIINRLKESKMLDKIVVATTEKKSDRRVIEISKENNISFFCGSEENVLSRYIGAARKFNADIIVRITGDCPLVDPFILDEAINEFEKNNLNYIGLREYPRGFGIEVVDYKSLLKANKKIELIKDSSKKSIYREHVTLYIYKHPEQFKVYRKIAPAEYNRNYRLCVDEKEDFTLIKEIYKRLYKKNQIIKNLDVIKLLDENPDLVKINSNVKQKKLNLNSANKKLK